MPSDPDAMHFYAAIDENRHSWGLSIVSSGGFLCFVFADKVADTLRLSGNMKFATAGQARTYIGNGEEACRPYFSGHCRIKDVPNAITRQDRHE